MYTALFSIRLLSENGNFFVVLWSRDNAVRASELINSWKCHDSKTGEDAHQCQSIEGLKMSWCTVAAVEAMLNKKLLGLN